MQNDKSLRLIYLLSTIGFFGIFSTTISKSPVLPLFIKALGGNDAIIGLISAISPLAGIIFSFPVGLLSDRIGPRKLLITSALVFFISPLLYLFVTNPWLLIPVRFFHGLATAILGPIAAMMIFSQYKSTKGEKIGLYSSATLIGRTIAPLAGGAILSYFALSGGLLSYRLVYIIAFAASIPVLVLAFTLTEDKKAKGNMLTLSAYATSLATFIGDGKLLATALVEMATYFAFGVFETYLPIFLVTKHFPAYQIGLIFSLQILSIALTKPIFGKIADRADKRLQILVGIVAIGICLALVPFGSSLAFFIVLGLAFGLAMSFSTVATGTYVADIAKDKELGASIGALSSIMDIGQSSGPFITGIIITSFGFIYGFAASFATAIAVSGWFVVATFIAPHR